MTHNSVSDALDPVSAPPAGPPDEGRDLVLSGALMPPSEAPPLQIHLGPRRAGQDLDLPAQMPPKSRPRTKFEDDTEQMLNAMIGDCHFLMREVAYRCLAQSSDAGDRLDFLRSALGCAETSTRIADSIARLRATPLDDDRRMAILLETNRLLGEEKENPENNDQDVASGRHLAAKAGSPQG